MVETLSSQPIPTLAEESTTNIRDLCADVIAKARDYTKAFQFRTEPSAGATEFWRGYQQRLAKYDKTFKYPGTVNPAKCAIKGWIYSADGNVQCVECKKELQLTIPSQETMTEEEQAHAAVNLLKNLRSQHDSLCSFQAAFHHSIVLHSVRDLMPQISSHVQPQLFKSEEIANEIASLAHIAEVQSSFPLYFAIAGWFVKKDKTLFCKLCLKTVNPADCKNEIMDPLQLHYDYCPILDTHPQWKLALEEYVYANSNPKSISENFALIQRQLASTGLETKTQVIAPQLEPDEEMPSMLEETEAGTIQANRTVESMHDARSQSVDVLEPPQLRDTDFEAEIRQETQKRKRMREETFGDCPSAKRTRLPFPHNYLAEYNQQIGDVSPTIEQQALTVPIDETIDLSASNTMDASTHFENTAPSSDIEREMAGVGPVSDASILNPDSEHDSEMIEEEQREIMSSEELDRMPLHEGGERDAQDSDDIQSAEAESYDDDEAKTDEDPVDETAPYNEPEEFADHTRNSEEGEEPHTAQQPFDKTIELDDGRSDEVSAQSAEDFGGYEGDEDEGEIEEPEFAQYSDGEDAENHTQQASGDDGSDSDIIVLD